jgi:hypothetical protein
MPRYFNLLKLFLPVFILGCSSNSDKESIVLNEVIASLEASNSSIDNSSQTFLNSLKDNLTDPSTSEVAKIWKPRAEMVYNLSQGVFGYIKQIKDELIEASTKREEKSFDEKNKTAVNKILFTDNRGEHLIIKLKNLREDFFKVDSNIRLAFQDSNFLPNEQSADYFFKGTTVLEALSFLTRMQNSIKVNENRIIAFCKNKIGHLDGPSMYSTYSAIIGQSSNIVKPGDKITIIAGVGAFSKAALPKIFVNNQLVEVDENAVANYVIKASNKPGNYTVPVKIDYIDDEGKKRILKQTIEYSVSNCQN